MNSRSACRLIWTRWRVEHRGPFRPNARTYHLEPHCTTMHVRIAIAAKNSVFSTTPERIVLPRKIQTLVWVSESYCRSSGKFYPAMEWQELGLSYSWPGPSF